MYDMPLRDYDPASAKWFNIDPVTHYDQSPFMAMNGNPVTFSDPSGADGHNWNPYSDMSMNNYGANGTSSPGRNSNGDNDGGSSIFWGSSRMLFEQSFESHAKGAWLETKDAWTTSDSGSILAFSNYIADMTISYDLPPANVPYGNRLKSGGIFENHYNYNSPFVHPIRDMIRGFANGLEDSGDILSGIGYALTLTGVGAEIGIPLAAVGNLISFSGTTLNIGTHFQQQGIFSGNAWTAAGFILLDKTSEHYAGKIPGFNELGQEIMKQNAGLKVMAIERYTQYLQEKK